MAKLLNLRNRARQLASKALKTMSKPFARCLGKTTPFVEDKTNAMEPATPLACEDEQPKTAACVINGAAAHSVDCSATDVEPKPVSPLTNPVVEATPAKAAPARATPVQGTPVQRLPYTPLPYTPSVVPMDIDPPAYMKWVQEGDEAQAKEDDGPELAGAVL